MGADMILRPIHLLAAAGVYENGVPIPAPAA